MAIGMKANTKALFLGFFLGFLATAAVPARADIIVIGSNTPVFAIGTVLTDDKTIDIPTGASVRIMTPAGKTQSLAGPLKKAVKDIASGSPADRALWDSVSARLHPGIVASDKFEGHTRGLTPKPASASYKFSWVAVPVYADGDVCVEKGAKLSLVRANAGKAERVAIVDMTGGGPRSDVTFAAGSSTAPWPSDIEPRVGTFAFQAPDQPIRQIKLRLIAPLPSADDAVRVLNGQRCELQRNALLEALKDPAFQISALGQ